MHVAVRGRGELSRRLSQYIAVYEGYETILKLPLKSGLRSILKGEIMVMHFRQAHIMVMKGLVLLLHSGRMPMLNKRDQRKGLPAD